MTFQELLKEERTEERRRIAKRMLEKGMDVEEIADCTGLTIIRLSKGSMKDSKNKLIHMTGPDLKPGPVWRLLSINLYSQYGHPMSWETH